MSKTLMENKRAWSSVRRDAKALNTYLSQLDPALDGVMSALSTRPEFFNRVEISKRADDVREVFLALFDALPGSPEEKYAALGRPRIIAEYLLLPPPIKRPPSHWTPVQEPATGKQWRSVSALAKEIGYSATHVHKHLAFGYPAALCGRVFTYGKKR